MSKKVRHLAAQMIKILFGNALYALGVAAFITPTGLITGGTTGIGLFVRYHTGMSLSLFVMLFNVAMFILGYAVLGKRFALTTIVSTFSYPIFLELFMSILPKQPLTEDLMLSALFGGALIGFAIGMVIRAGASTGGMDIPPLVLNRFFRIPVSASIFAFDILILILQASFSDKEAILYGIVLVAVYTVVLDQVLVIGQSRMEVRVISHRAEDIRQAIVNEIDRGVTFLHGRTGYLGEETEVLMTVVTNRELVRTEKRIHEIDPEAFVIINRVSEVRGRGFTGDKRYVDQSGQEKR